MTSERSEEPRVDDLPPEETDLLSHSISGKLSIKVRTTDYSVWESE